MTKQINFLSVTILASALALPSFANAKEDVSYMPKIGGVLKLDHTSFFGDRNKRSQAGNEPGTYHSGAFIRSLGLDVDGNLGNDWTYTVGLAFAAKSKQVSVEDAYLTYNGFKFFGDNFSVSIGSVNPGFCLENTSSSKWIPFREQSMFSRATAPCSGLGVSINKYTNNFSLTAEISQPKASDTVKDENETEIQRSDRWQGSARITVAPIAEEGRVVQFGISGHLKDHANSGIQFSTAPEARSKNFTTLLDTTTNTDPKVRILAKSQANIDVELALQRGPLTAEAEYQRVYVNRGNNSAGAVQGKDLTFQGYHVQAAYVLTGEVRPHKKNSGTFGQIKPESCYGAWEIAARYSFLDLNDEDIKGGLAHNTTLSLSWYANNHIRVIGEYVYSKHKREVNNVMERRNLSALGLRLQAVF